MIDYIPGIEEIKPRDMVSYLQSTDTSTICHQLIFAAFRDAKGADFFLCNTVEELEPHTISALQAKIRFYAVGPIFPPGFTKSIVPTSLWSESDCTHWLDAQPEGSVLYVSFGSYAHISKEDLMEIANGLRLSKISFVWVLRPDIVSSDDPHPLPEELKDEVRCRSIIIPWCCQIAVLAHPAVGGFLTHCGWNSILEGLWCRVPLLCFPLLTDQFTNRRLVVDDWKVGINLTDGESISREEVSEKINSLMRGKSSVELLKRIDAVKQTLENVLKPDGSSENNINQFIDDLKTRTQENYETASVL